MILLSGIGKLAGSRQSDTLSKKHMIFFLIKINQNAHTFFFVLCREKADMKKRH